MKLRFLLCVILAVLAPAPLTWAQEASSGDAVVIYSAGVDALLPSQKDAALRRALKLLDDRLAELPQELDEPEIPADALGTVLGLLLQPLTLRAGVIEDADAGELPIYAQLMVEGESREQAQREARMLLEMLLAAGPPAEPRPVPGHSGMHSFDAGGVPGYLGSMQTGGGHAIVAAVNQLMAPDPSPPAVQMPDGVEPVFAVHVDGQKLVSLMEAALTQAPPQEAEMIRLQMSLYGLTGESPMGFQMGYGHEGGLAHSVLRYINYLSAPMARDIIVREPLRSKDMAMIPADAHYAQVSRVDLSKYPELIREGMKASGPEMDQGPMMDQTMEMVADMTGVHPERDLFAHLGTAMGYYTAQSTGGGGLGSLVGFVELKNPADFRTSLDMLAAFLNQLAEGQARGYVKIQTRELNGQEMTSLSFPGLPVPIEPSWTVHGDSLLTAATPQALLAAMEQAAEGGSDLRQAEGFRELAQGRVEQAMGVTYMNTKAMASRGYGLASLGMSALANALQSPRGEEGRDPGLIMPTYSALMEDVHPSVTVYRLEGDDLIVESRADASTLVNLSAIAGLLGDAPTAMAVGSAIAGALTGVGEARRNAEHTQASASLRVIAVAVFNYAADQGGKSPPNLETLAEEDYLTQDALQSIHGPVGDGGGDYWFHEDLGDDLYEIEGAFRFIIAYDRAAYASAADAIAVLYADGHVELLEMWEFLEQLEAPQHEGIDFNLPEW